MISFDIPIRTVSGLNTREHHRVRAKRVKAEREATAIAWRIYAARGSSGVFVQRSLDAGLVVTFIRLGPQDLDDDNLPGSCKAIRDQLADEMGLPNDRDKRVSWVYQQARGKHGVRVLITTRVQTSAEPPLAFLDGGGGRQNKSAHPNASKMTHETATIRKSPSAIGAEKKREQVVKRADARRRSREADDEPTIPRRTEAEIVATAEALLEKHSLVKNPATRQLARIHVQMCDAVDALYDTAVREGKEQRQISAMVSAGKLAVTALDKLGLPGDDLEDESAEARERAIAEKMQTPARTTKAPTATHEKPDDLEAYE